jgi:hypothetical protein
MSAVFEAREVNHAVNAGKRGSAAAVSVRIEFLLGENVSAALILREDCMLECCWARTAAQSKFGEIRYEKQTAGGRGEGGEERFKYGEV